MTPRHQHRAGSAYLRQLRTSTPQALPVDGRLQRRAGAAEPLDDPAPGDDADFWIETISYKEPATTSAACCRSARFTTGASWRRPAHQRPHAGPQRRSAQGLCVRAGERAENDGCAGTRPPEAHPEGAPSPLMAVSGIIGR